jgi:proteic killer suppression protein
VRLALEELISPMVQNRAGTLAASPARCGEVSSYTRYSGIIRLMIRSFADAGSEDVFNGRNTEAARRQLPRDLWLRACRLLDQLQRAHVLGDMAQPPGNRLEPLADGRHSVRVNDQYRVTFRWKDGAAEEVWCGDYHD